MMQKHPRSSTNIWDICISCSYFWIKANQCFNSQISSSRKCWICKRANYWKLLYRKIIDECRYDWMQTTGSFLNKLVSFHEHLKEHSVKEHLLVFLWDLYVDFMDKTRLTLILKCMIQEFKPFFFAIFLHFGHFPAQPDTFRLSWRILSPNISAQPQSGSWHLNESKYLQLVFRLIL